MLTILAIVFGGSFVIVMLIFLLEVHAQSDDLQSTGSRRSPTIPKRVRGVSGAEEALAQHLLLRPIVEDARSGATPG